MADQGVGDAEMAGGIAGFDDLSVIEDHGGELVEGRGGFAGIALEAFQVRHRVVVEIEAAGAEQALQRADGDIIGGDGVEQRVGHRVLADGAMALPR